MSWYETEFSPLELIKLPGYIHLSSNLGAVPLPLLSSPETPTMCVLIYLMVARSPHRFCSLSPLIFPSAPQTHHASHPTFGSVDAPLCLPHLLFSLPVKLNSIMVPFSSRISFWSVSLSRHSRHGHGLLSGSFHAFPLLLKLS